MNKAKQAIDAEKERLKKALTKTHEREQKESERDGGGKGFKEWGKRKR